MFRMEFYQALRDQQIGSWSEKTTQKYPKLFPGTPKCGVWGMTRMVYVAYFESSDNDDLRTTIRNPESRLEGFSEWQWWGLKDEHWAIMLVVLWGIPQREGAIIGLLREWEMWAK